MFRQRHIAVFLTFTLYDMQHLPVKIQMLKFDIPDFHTTQAAPVDETDQQFVFQEFRRHKHTPDLFPAQDHRKFLHLWNGGKVQITIRQAFGFQQKPQPVDSVLKVRLRRCFGALLQFKKIIFDLFRIQLGGQSFKMHREGCHMAGIIVERFGTPAQNGNIPFETLQEFGKTLNFVTGAVQKFVYP